jgi:hypothetical protein
VGKEEEGIDRPADLRPFESLRREVDRLFEDFQLGSWRSSPSSVETRARKVESCRFGTWNSAPAKLSAAAFFADDRRPL